MTHAISLNRITHRQLTTAVLIRTNRNVRSTTTDYWMRILLTLFLLKKDIYPNFLIQIYEEKNASPEKLF